MEESFKPAQCHPDQPEKAKGMCQSCYRVDLKAKRIASKVNQVQSSRLGKNELEVVRDLEKDPEVKKKFYAIMWEWLEEAEVDPVYKIEGGKRVRDYVTEARLKDVAQRKADKAATVLGKAYVVEKREEVKPVPLPLGVEIDSSGWESEGDEGEQDTEGETNDGL